MNKKAEGLQSRVKKFWCVYARMEEEDYHALTFSMSGFILRFRSEALNGLSVNFM